jgi:hypothetical protein
MVTLMVHVLAVLGAGLAWFVFAYFRPRRRCRKCQGWGSSQRRRQRTACGRCKGTGRTMRLSSRLAHHAVHHARLQLAEFIERRREVS